MYWHQPVILIDATPTSHTLHPCLHLSHQIAHSAADAEAGPAGVAACLHLRQGGGSDTSMERVGPAHGIDASTL